MLRAPPRHRRQLVNDPALSCPDRPRGSAPPSRAPMPPCHARPTRSAGAAASVTGQPIRLQTSLRHCKTSQPVRAIHLAHVDPARHQATFWAGAWVAARCAPLPSERMTCGHLHTLHQAAKRRAADGGAWPPCQPQHPSCGLELRRETWSKLSMLSRAVQQTERRLAEFMHLRFNSAVPHAAQGAQ